MKNEDLISRQQAIDALYNVDEYNQRSVTAIKNLPSIQPDTTTHDSIPAENGRNDDDRTSDDCISRQRAIEAVEKSMYENPHENAILRGMHDHEHKHFLTILMGLPSAQPERKTGHWILDRSGAYCCSKCMEPCAGYIMMKPRDKFCKMCGSRNEVME